MSAPTAAPSQPLPAPGRSLRAWLLGFGLLLTLGIAGFAITDHIKHQSLDLARAEAMAKRGAGVIGNHALLTLQMIEESLHDLAMITRETRQGSGGPPAVQQHLRERAERLDYLLNLALYDDQQRLVYALHPLPPSLDRLQDVPGLGGVPADRQGLWVGLPFRPDMAERTWALPAMLPFRAPDNGSDWLAVALIDLRHFERYFAALDLGLTQANFALVRDDGIILTQYPDPDRAAVVGRALGDAPPFPMRPDRPALEGIAVEDGRDGSARIVAHAASGGLPLFATVVVSWTDALADSRQRTVEIGSVSVLALFAVWSVILLLLRRERREAQIRRDLAVSNQKFRSYVDRSADPIFVTGPNGTYREVNAAAGHLAGYAPDTLLGRKVREFLVEDPENVQANRRLAREARTTGVAMGELRLRRSDGTVFPVELTLSRLDDGALLGHARDITERLASAQTLASRDAILQSISLAAELLLSAGPDREPDFRPILELLGEAARVDRVTLLEGRPVGDDLELCMTAAWRTPQAPADPDEAYGPVMLRQRGMATLLDRYRAGEPYIATDEEAEGAARKMMERRHVRSVVGFPFLVDGSFAGVLGLHACFEPRRWHPAELGALAIAARLIGGVRQRQRDDAARRAALAQLERITANLPGMVFEAMADPLSDVDANGNAETAGPNWGFTFVSANSQTLLGLSPEALLADARRYLPQIHEDDRERVGRSIAMAVRERRAWEVEFRAQDGNGRLRWLRGTSVRQPQPDGRSLWTGVLIDVTSLKATEDAMRIAKEAAERANRAKSEFLATVSHELRTPMNGVLGFAGLLRDTPLDAEQASHVETIESSGRALLGLIDDILDLAKLETGHIDLSRDVVDLRDLLASVRKLLSVLARDKGLELRVLVGMAVPPAVRGDLNRLRQILVNLATNAVKFTDAGHIDIVADMTAAGQLRLAVCDTGIGIAEADQERLFERFTQLDSARTRSHGGIGLGLSICKRLVEAMGGTIGVDSRLGEGSRFWVDLPLEVVGDVPDPIRPPPRPAPLGQGRPQGSARRILVAEDDPASQILAREVIRAIGHHPELVGDGEAALAAVRAGGIDLVLMDLDMPKLDGLSAARAIRALPPPLGTVPILALTAKAMAGDAQAAFDVGMNAHIPKPLDIEALVVAIDRHLAEHNSTG